MARLTTLKPLVAKLAPRLGYAPSDEKARSRYRDETEEHRGWYQLARWKAKPHGLRWQTLVRAMFTCRICKQISRHPNASDMVADHITPHRGDPALFWDACNIQCLCKGCHDSVKQAEERQHGRW